jgi:hypothetical protein
MYGVLDEYKKILTFFTTGFGQSITKHNIEESWRTAASNSLIVAQQRPCSSQGDHSEARDMG